MSEFVSPAAVKIEIKAHLAMHHHRPNAFVDVQLMPGGTQAIYVITTETAFVSQVQALLEDKLGRTCVYGAVYGGSFLVYGNEIERLVT